MPSILDENVEIVSPYLYRQLVFTASGGVDYTDFGQGYFTLPLREYRESTNYNSPKVNKLEKPLSPFKLRLLEWYEQKPRITQSSLFFERNIRHAFHLAKVDWRSKRPVKDPNWVPEGWVLKTVRDVFSKYERIADGTDRTFGKFIRFRSQPIMVRRLRPSDRLFRRANPHLASNLRVNDLLYFRQSSPYFYGAATFFVTKDAGTRDRRPAEDGGNLLGELNLYEYHPEDHFTGLGLSSSPFQFSLLDSVVDRADPLVTYAAEVTELSDRALKRHYAKLANQKIDLATELSQAMQTVNMILDLAKRLGGTFLKLKKLDLLGAFKLLFPTSRKELANDYLVYKYGIEPLLGDLEGAAEHLAEYVLRARPVKSSGRATKTVVTEELVSSPYGKGFRRRTTKIRVKYSSIFSVSNDAQRQAAMLGFTNPVNVIWELVPFSFVADWFLPIGNWLQSMSALDGLTIKESYKTVFIDTVEEVFELFENQTSVTAVGSALGSYPPYFLNRTDGLQDPGYLFFEGGGQGWMVNTIFCKREVIPLPDVPLPKFKNPISTVHLAEALALFQQLR